MKRKSKTEASVSVQTLPSENDIWYVIGSYFHRFGIVRHQIESFDAFMTSHLPHIIQESSEIIVKSANGNEEHSVSLCNVSVQRPMIQESDGYERLIMPHMARMRSVTYAANVLVDIVHDISLNGKHAERRVFREVLLCKLPVMVGSMYCHTFKAERKHECRLDQGGYFLINGIEKALLAQEKLHTNQAYIFKVKQPSKYQLVCEIRSCHELKMRSTSTLYIYITSTKKGAIPEMVASLPFIDMHVPILALFKLLGVDTRAEALELIVGDLDAEESRLLCGILDNDTTCDMSSDDLLEWLGREGTKEPTKERRMRYLEHIITNEMLPHMGLTLEPRVNRAKACFLGFMVRKLINVYTGQLQCDDRDHYANKRIDTAGMLMSLLFRQVYRTQLKTLSSQLHRLMDQNKLRYTNIGDIINHKKITGQFKYAFSTGNWGMQRGNSAQTGVAQMMSRMTTVAALANLRRINTPINREGKAPKPRQLHYTSWGIVCPVETPEGTSCGLVKNLAMMAHVRIGTHSGAVKEQLDRLKNVTLIPLLECDNAIRARGVPVFVNGTLYMYAPTEEEGAKVLTKLREIRRENLLPFDASLSFADNAICIDTDPGCLLRPLIVANKVFELHDIIRSNPPYDQLWELLLSKGIVEYVDKQEEIDLRVGMNIMPEVGEFTHFELHPSLQNGLCASLIPFPDHNQAPRNCYQSAMGKQAVGIIALNYPMRMDAINHVLCSPQKPLVTTKMDDILHTSEAPTGTNVMVVIMTYSGFNQEDSLIVNREALQRGLFRSVKFQTFKDEERVNGADSEKFENPTDVANCAGMRIGCYDKLGADGFLPVGSDVQSGDVILGKTITTTEIGEGTRRAVKRDRSVIIKHSDEAIIDAIMKSTNRDGSMLAKVRTRSTRTPIVGDKLSSRHGQKGVIGIVLNAADMPVTESGMVPDIIVNPHAIPSRMTIGQLMECLLGKLCCVQGSQGDATPFRGTSIEQIGDQLEQYGYDRLGNESFYNGMTGEQMPGTVFFGPVYYQRLKHMVSDKQHSRSRGPVQILTRQPVEGRAREGGLRFGEMERDCFTEDHQILTDHGFMFLKDIEALENQKELKIASYDQAAEDIVYEPMKELIVNPIKTRTLIEMTQQVESYRWGDNSDIYGRSMADLSRAENNGTEVPNAGTTGKPKNINGRSNYVSLVMTPKHRVIYKSGKVGKRSSTERQGDNYVIWNGFEKSNRDRTERKRYEYPYETHLAQEMLTSDPSRAIKMMASAKNGLRSANIDMPFVNTLGLKTQEQIMAFLELYGYWLGDGTLGFKKDMIVFSVVKPHDIEWLQTMFKILELSPVSYTDKEMYVYTIQIKEQAYVSYFHEEYKTKYKTSDAFVHSECKSAKWFMNWVWTLDKDPLRAIISGVRRADGCQSKGNNKIYTSSVRFRDELVRACLHAGYSPRFYVTYLAGEYRGVCRRNGSPIIAKHTSWAVTYPDPSSGNTHYSRPVLYNARDVKEVEHTGRTWCVNVPPHHTIIVRRAHEHEGVVTKVSAPIISHQCIISHGCANVISERLFEQSDPFVATVCKKCGYLAQPSADKTLLRQKKPFCKVCNDSSNVYDVRMPYAFKLLLQELMAMSIAPRLSLKCKQDDEPATAPGQASEPFNFVGID